MWCDAGWCEAEWLVPLQHSLFSYKHISQSVFFPSYTTSIWQQLFLKNNFVHIKKSLWLHLMLRNIHKKVCSCSHLCNSSHKQPFPYLYQSLKRQTSTFHVREKAERAKNSILKTFTWWKNSITNRVAIRDSFHKD